MDENPAAVCQGLYVYIWGNEVFWPYFFMRLIRHGLVSSAILTA